MSRTQKSVSQLCASVGPTEQAHLRDVGRAQPRHAALALERFDQRALLAADVGAGSAAQHDRRHRGHRRAGGALDLGGERRAQAVVLVAQVDPARRGPHRPGRHQHAFQEAVRVAFEPVAILEGARLALVDVDHQQPRRRLGGHDAPLAPGRETRAAQSPQVGRFERRHDLLARGAALGLARGVGRVQRREQRVAALGAVARERLAVGERCRRLGAGAAVDQRRRDRLGRGRAERVAPDADRGRLGAAADARRAQHPHARAGRGRQLRVQRLGAGHRAGDRVAHAHRRRRRRGLAVRGQVEVVVEARDLVHLGHRQAHQVGQRHQRRPRQAPVGVLQRVQAFDQRVARRHAAAVGADQGGHARALDRIGAAPARHRAGAAVAQRLVGGRLHRASWKRGGGCRQRPMLSAPAMRDARLPGAGRRDGLPMGDPQRLGCRPVGAKRRAPDDEARNAWREDRAGGSRARAGRGLARDGMVGPGVGGRGAADRVVEGRVGGRSGPGLVRAPPAGPGAGGAGRGASAAARGGGQADAGLDARVDARGRPRRGRHGADIVHGADGRARGGCERRRRERRGQGPGDTGRQPCGRAALRRRDGALRLRRPARHRRARSARALRLATCDLRARRADTTPDRRMTLAAPDNARRRLPTLRLRVLRAPPHGRAPGLGEAIALPQEGGLLGRATHCTVVLADGGGHVSRVQAELRPSETGWTVRDRGSAVPTRLRDARGEERQADREQPDVLADGDVLAIDGWELGVELGDARPWAAPQEIGRTLYAWKLAGGALDEAGLATLAAPGAPAALHATTIRRVRDDAPLGELLDSALRGLAGLLAVLDANEGRAADAAGVALPDARRRAAEPLRSADPLAALASLDPPEALAAVRAAVERIEAALAGRG
jgi:hypothetical protein